MARTQVASLLEARYQHWKAEAIERARRRTEAEPARNTVRNDGADVAAEPASPSGDVRAATANDPHEEGLTGKAHDAGEARRKTSPSKLEDLLERGYRQEMQDTARELRLFLEAQRDAGGALRKAVAAEKAENEPAANSGAPLAQRANLSKKRGPKPDYESASRVAEIVDRMAPDGDWRSKLDVVGDALDHGVCNASDPTVCAASDHEKIPLPRGWRQKKTDWVNPPDRATMVKAIEYRLESARKKPIAETLS